MKVTLINHSDTAGGASVVTFRLMEALRAEGVDARMLVTKKNTDSPYVTQIAPDFRSRLPFLAEHLRIFTHNGFSRKRLFQVSIATDGLPISKHPLVKEADAVVFNWINQGMLSLKEIGNIAALKPTLWTMHDQWNFTSICHHSGSCDRFMTHCNSCPFLGNMASAHDLSFRTFDKKKELYDSTEITFVAVSDWLASRAQKSALFSGCRVETIPNAFPVERFSAPPTLSRKQLGLPEGKKLILFCAARIDDPGKGLSDAIILLNGLAEMHSDTVMAVFAGEFRIPQTLSSLKLPHICLGPVSGSDVIPSLMKHADIVLSTSPFETLSTVMIEAQAAGATPVGYTHDGRGDIVTDGINGYSLKSKNDTDSLLKAIKKPIPREILREAAMRYSAEAIAKRYISLIENTIGQRTLR